VGIFSDHFAIHGVHLDDRLQGFYEACGARLLGELWVRCVKARCFTTQSAAIKLIPRKFIFDFSQPNEQEEQELPSFYSEAWQLLHRLHWQCWKV
jgi:hypothetical protein